MTQVGGSRHAIEPPSIESGCTGLTCNLETMIAIVVVLGAVSLGAVALIRCVQHARRACSFEHERLVAEYEAFLEFADQVADLTVAPRPDGGQQMTPMVARTGGDGLEDVKDAYRDTVMEIPHYETDYDEPLEKHMATELSPQLAVAVSQSDQLTPAIRNPLVASARSAARDRRILADQLEEELSDLDDAEGTIQGISDRVQMTGGEGLLQRTYPELQSRWRRLDGLQADVQELLVERQQQLRDRAPGGGSELTTPEDVSNYLYGGLDVDFPVLNSGTELLERVEREKRETVKALSERRR